MSDTWSHNTSFPFIQKYIVCVWFLFVFYAWKKVLIYVKQLGNFSSMWEGLHALREHSATRASHGLQTKWSSLAYLLQIGSQEWENVDQCMGP